MDRDPNDNRTGGWFRISSCLTNDKIVEEEIRPWIGALNTIRNARPDFFKELMVRVLLDPIANLNRRS